MEKNFEQEIVENNASITLLLKRNEELYQKALNESTTVSVRNEDRIKIPSGFIGTRFLFVEEGHPKDLVPNRVKRSNIAYAMQLSDFYRYTLNRFYIWGSVETMLCKSAIINLVAIMSGYSIGKARVLQPNTLPPVNATFITKKKAAVCCFSSGNSKPIGLQTEQKLIHFLAPQTT